MNTFMIIYFLVLAFVIWGYSKAHKNYNGVVVKDNYKIIMFLIRVFVCIIVDIIFMVLSAVVCNLIDKKGIYGAVSVIIGIISILIAYFLPIPKRWRVVKDSNTTIAEDISMCKTDIDSSIIDKTNIEL